MLTDIQPQCWGENKETWELLENECPNQKGSPFAAPGKCCHVGHKPSVPRSCYFFQRHRKSRVIDKIQILKG